MRGCRFNKPNTCPSAGLKGQSQDSLGQSAAPPQSSGTGVSPVRNVVQRTRPGRPCHVRQPFKSENSNHESKRTRNHKSLNVRFDGFCTAQAQTTLQQITASSRLQARCSAHYLRESVCGNLCDRWIFRNERHVQAAIGPIRGTTKKPLLSHDSRGSVSGNPRHRLSNRPPNCHWIQITQGAGLPWFPEQTAEPAAPAGTRRTWRPPPDAWARRN